MSAPPPARESRPLKRAVLRFTLLALLLASGFALARWGPLSEHLTGDTLMTVLERLRSARWAPLALVGLYALLAPVGVPISPLVLAGGVVFGPAWGALYNFIGTMMGAGLSHLLATALGRDLVVHLAGQRLVARAEALLERHGFWTLVRIRFVPIPFAAVNYTAALAGFRLPSFLLASVIGLAPTMVIYTYFGHALVGVATENRQALLVQLVVVVMLVLLLTFLPTLARGWKGRRDDL